MFATMNETNPPISSPGGPRLWTPQGFREDEWAHADNAEALAGNGRFILPLRVFLDLEPQMRLSAKERLGVVVQPGEDIATLLPLLGDLTLVALAFPAFNDGRSFSKAELLRGRHGFRGPLRAVGQVLVDQLPHMLRLGFDEFEISNRVLIGRLEAGRIGGLPLHYQPTAAKPLKKGGKYSWRRVPGSS